MFRRALLPLDGSPRAERALAVVARITRGCGAHLLLLRAVVVPGGSGVAFDPVPLSGDWIRHELDRAEEYLRRIAKRPELEGHACQVLTLVGPADVAILETAASQHCDLIVLTSHGTSGLARWVLGSVASRVARQASATVLVLREGRALPMGEVPLRVLVPLDGSTLAESALPPVLALARALEVPLALHLALVLAPAQARPTSGTRALLLDGAESYLASVAERLRAAQAEPSALSVTSAVEVGADVAGTLLRVAEPERVERQRSTEPRFDLLALATHGRTGLARWAVGSITERVLHTAQVPLLIVRASAVAGAAPNAVGARLPKKEGR